VADLRAKLKQWREDPVAFCEALIDPETGKPFVLYAEQKAFLRAAFERTADGRLLYPELLYSAVKKAGKTAFAAAILIYVVLVLGGRYAEGYCAANDLEQSQGRVFQATCRIIEATPFLVSDAHITANRIAFESTGATITALANDYAGAAGANPTITVFDELWAYTSERAHRFWDEMVPPPTRATACRLTVTYAGFEGESDLLEKLCQRGLKGKRVSRDMYAQPGLLMFWSHRMLAPWQTEAWREQMRGQLRPNAYLRMIENRWVSGEEAFVDPAWWARCVDPEARPLVADVALPVWGGVDASVKRDSTAIVACCWDHAAKKVRLVCHRIFQPTLLKPIDFERDVEATLLDLRQRFYVREVRYDPYQMQASAQRLQRAGVPMVEFPQSVPNLTEASTNLFELIKGGNLVCYDDAALDKAIKQTVAVETPRGWRLAKEKTSARIDVVVALAQAALGAVRGGQNSAPIGAALQEALALSEEAHGSSAALNEHVNELEFYAGRPGGSAPWE
jgi:phage terminase large subunit-like protein